MSSAKRPSLAIRASHFVPVKLIARANSNSPRAVSSVDRGVNSTPSKLVTNPAPNSATEVIVTISAQMYTQAAIHA